MFWDVCTVPDAAVPYNIQFGALRVLDSKTDLCMPRPSWWWQGRCSRSIVETLVPLFLKKMALRAFLQPIITMSQWRASTHDENGQLRLRVFGFRTDGCQDPHKQLAFLVTLGEMGLLWGALIPPLVPLVALAVISNRVTLVAGAVQFGANPPVDHAASLSKTYLNISIGTLVAFIVWFSQETEMHGQTLILAVAVILSVRAVCLTFWFSARPWFTPADPRDGSTVASRSRRAERSTTQDGANTIAMELATRSAGVDIPSLSEGAFDSEVPTFVGSAHPAGRMEAGRFAVSRQDALDIELEFEQRVAAGEARLAEGRRQFIGDLGPGARSPAQLPPLTRATRDALVVELLALESALTELQDTRNRRMIALVAELRSQSHTGA